MDKTKIHRTNIKDQNNLSISLVYNESDDILDIFFDENEAATGIELTDHILLRLNRETGRAVSLTLHHFSVLTERTEYGPRSFPLDKLEELPDHLRETTVRAITTSPVNNYLKLSFFQESPVKRFPLTYVEPYGMPSVA